jgi:hypothetical protein
VTAPLDVIADKADHLREEVAAGMKAGNAVVDETVMPIPTPTNEEVAETPKRPWWRRLVG